VACHALWNKQSETVLKKNGMSFIEYIPEGFKKKGEWIEENLLGITQSEWNEKELNKTVLTIQEAARPEL
jgi:RimJ/RimL family protein N-acetyltransferase